MAAAGDPFDVVRAEVEQNLNKIQQQFATMEGRGPGSDTSFAREQLQGSIRTVEWDLQDLEETIRVVLGNRNRFAMTDREVQSRQSFVSEAKRKVAEWKQRLETADSSLFGKRRPATDPSVINQNDAFIENELQHQAQIIRQQDQGLEELAQTVQRIGTMGLVMHQELNEQADILDDIDQGMDSTTERLRMLQRKLEQIMSETGRSRLCLIIWLFVAFIVLTILVVVI